jgi:hypothetical protein
VKAFTHFAGRPKSAVFKLFSCEEERSRRVPRGAAAVRLDQLFLSR